MPDSVLQFFSKQDFLSGDWLIFYAGLLVGFSLWLGRILWNKYNTQPKVTISKVFADNMPTTDNAELVGRDDTLKLFHQAWKSNDTRVLALVATGGVGKSSVLNAWREKLAENPEHAPPRIYCWSFHNQGSTNTETSSSDFFTHALQWFGSEKTKFNSEREKGLYLASRINQEKVLLVLDGLEVFQHIEAANAGYVRDKAMLALVDTLAQNNPGLCLIATREAFNEKQIRRKGLVTNDLSNLNNIAALHLLRRRRIKGSDEALLDCVRSYQGHAQSLTLLANYLRDYHRGDIRKVDRLPELKQWMGEETGNRLFAAYEAEWVKSPELAMLYLVSLFEKSVKREIFDALVWALDQRRLAGFNGWLKPLLKNKVCDRSIKRLEKASLLSFEGQSLDMHPAARKYFRHSFQYHFPSTWKQAHIELYEYYKALPEKELPDTVEEMQPLFYAVAHGCAAGLHQQALDDVFSPRIDRREAYIVNKFGAYSDALVVVTQFFTQSWRVPASGLIESDQAFLLNVAGFSLRALGRLHEAVEPIQASLEMHAKQERWRAAATNASNLSTLHLNLGRVSDALVFGEKSVVYANQSGEMFSRIRSQAIQADVLHQAGRTDKALNLFAEAGQLQQEDDPEFPQLYSWAGFRYCDLLLTESCAAKALELAEQNLEWMGEEYWLSGKSLDKLTLGRAYHALGYIPQAHNWLEQAVVGLREAGDQTVLPNGLLARAALYRDTDKFDLAQQDLAEVWEIAESGEMRLFMVDYHLEMARLLLASKGTGNVQHHITEADRLIQETGYHRRDPELAALKQQMGH